MANPRPTYQQRLFNDGELALPLHDQIVRWTDLAMRNRPGIILDALGMEHSLNDTGQAFGWGPNLICFARTRGYVSSAEPTADRLALHLAPPKPDAPPITIERIKWEPILKTDKGGILGAVDLSATISLASPSLSYDLQYLNFSEAPDWVRDGLLSWRDKILCCDGLKIWVSRERQALSLGAAQLAEFLGPSVIIDNTINRVSDIRWHPSGSQETIKLMVEAKTSVRSAGELIRQINLYRHAAGSDVKFLVVAPAPAWAEGIQEILTEQGISTLTYMSNG